MRSWLLDDMHLTLDALLDVISQVISPSDVSALCLTSRDLNYYATRRLYNGALFKSTVACIAGVSLDEAGCQQYEILLQTLCDRPDLARHVRVFAVPRTPPLRPARIDIVALLHSVVVNTPNITSFTWMNIFPIPLRILTCLSTLPHLESLTIPLPFVAPFPRNAHTIHRNRESYNARTEVVLSIRPLKHLHLRLFASIESDDKKDYVKWIASMGDTLCSLEMQGAIWLDNSMLSTLILPRLETFIVTPSSRITSQGISAFRRTSPLLTSVKFDV